MKDSIRITVLLEDPNAGDDGKQYHKQAEVSKYLLDESSTPERDKLEIVGNKVVAGVVDAWDDGDE